MEQNANECIIREDSNDVTTEIGTVDFCEVCMGSFNVSAQDAVVIVHLKSSKRPKKP